MIERRNIRSWSTSWDVNKQRGVEPSENLFGVDFSEQQEAEARSLQLGAGTSGRREIYGG
jgi:hypothetical protein